MLNWLKRWWYPSKFHVTYFHMPECEFHDKFNYNTLKDAINRKEYLLNLSEEELTKEGILFTPSYFRVLQLDGPNAIRRLLNKCGSKRMYSIFGFKI